MSHRLTISIVWSVLGMFLIAEAGLHPARQGVPSAGHAAAASYSAADDADEDPQQAEFRDGSAVRPTAYSRSKNGRDSVSVYQVSRLVGVATESSSVGRGRPPYFSCACADFASAVGLAYVRLVI